MILRILINVYLLVFYFVTNLSHYVSLSSIAFFSVSFKMKQTRNCMTLERTVDLTVMLPNHLLNLLPTASQII